MELCGGCESELGAGVAGRRRSGSRKVEFCHSALEEKDIKDILQITESLTMSGYYSQRGLTNRPSGPL